MQRLERVGDDINGQYHRATPSGSSGMGILRDQPQQVLVACPPTQGWWLVRQDESIGPIQWRVG